MYTIFSMIFRKAYWHKSEILNVRGYKDISRKDNVKIFVMLPT